MSILKNNRSVRILIFSLALGMMILLGQTQNAVARAPAGIGTGADRNLFALGNEAYAKGDYDQAVSHYKTAMARDGYAPSILYNLGNAYYMKKEIGQSILNYERALYLDPENAHIKANLALARKNSGLMMPERVPWKTFFNRMTLNGWTWVAVFALCAFSLMVLLRGIRPGIFGARISKVMVSACLLFFSVAGVGMGVQYGNLNRGIITGGNTRLRISPFDSAADSGPIKDGNVVQLANTYEGYIFVKEADGKSGWIPKGTVDAILPSEGNHQTQTSFTQSISRKINKNGGESKTDKT